MGGSSFSVLPFSCHDPLYIFYHAGEGSYRASKEGALIATDKTGEFTRIISC